MEVVLGMSFLFLNNADVEFAELGKLIWKTCTTIVALPTTSQVELIDKKEFAGAALNQNSKTFVVHVTVLEVPTAIFIYPSKTSQVQRLNKPILAAL